MKSIVLLHVGFALFNAAHVGQPRALPQPPGELGMLFASTHGVNLHAAIIEIARVAADVEIDGRALREVPEAHALDASAN